MNTASPPRPTYRRHIFYVDKTIQRPLLIVLVVLEVSLVVAATGFAYWHLNNLIDESLYRVHISDTGPIWQRLAKDGALILAGFAAINVLALLVAEGLWSRFENAVLGDFNRLTRKTQALDFTVDSEVDYSHDVLTLSMAWRDNERKRFCAIREQMKKLQVIASSDHPEQGLRSGLAGIQKLISLRSSPQ